MRNNKERDEEQVDLDGDEEAEEMDEVEDEGDDEDDEKPDVQDGLDLDIAEDEGAGSQDEQGDQNANFVNSGHDNNSFEDYAHNDTLEDVPVAEGSNDNAQKDVSNDEDLLSRPPHGTEVFVTNLPRDTSKEDLKALCEQCGEVFEVNIKKETNKQDYAFVTFTTRDAAKKAIETLSGHEFKDKKLRIAESQPKNRLFLGNIPPNWNEEELTKSVSEHGPGFQHLELIKDPKDSSRNRGFAFVEYYNKGCAEKAMRNMTQSKFKLDDKVITVKWASAQQRTSSEEVKSVYVRNLPENVTEDQLRELFRKHGEITKVVLMDQKPGQPKRDFGFVHFAEHSSAVKAAEKTEKYELDGKELSVSLARPMSERKPQNMVNPPYQRSVFPNFPPHAGYAYGSNMYRGMGVGFGAAGYSQPVIYGRGPTPEGMMMVPMILPDGRIGYVLQQPGNMPGGPAPYGSEGSGRHRDHRSGRSSRSGSGGSRHGSGRSSGSGSRSRYHPY